MRFQFHLRPCDQIPPWGDPPKQTLSWFALTDGHFYIDTEAGPLCCYSDVAQEQPGVEPPGLDYQVAAMARCVLKSVPAATAPVPREIEVLMGDWARFSAQLRGEDDPDESYNALRWLGERSAGLDFFTHSPRVFFVRVGDDVQVCWDHRKVKDDGVPVFSGPEVGSFRMPVPDFTAEARRFADELLGAMGTRIDDLEAGRISAQIKLDPERLRSQHSTWVTDFDSYFKDAYEPDIEWEVTLGSIRRVIAP